MWKSINEWLDWQVLVKPFEACAEARPLLLCMRARSKYLQRSACARLAENTCNKMATASLMHADWQGRHRGIAYMIVPFRIVWSNMCTLLAPAVRFSNSAAFGQ